MPFYGERGYFQVSLLSPTRRHSEINLWRICLGFGKHLVFAQITNIEKTRHKKFHEGVSYWAVPYPLTSGSNHSGGKVQLVIKRSLFPSIPSQNEWNEQCVFVLSKLSFPNVRWLLLTVFHLQLRICFRQELAIQRPSERETDHLLWKAIVGENNWIFCSHIRTYLCSNTFVLIDWFWLSQDQKVSLCTSNIRGLCRIISLR